MWKSGRGASRPPPRERPGLVLFDLDHLMVLNDWWGHGKMDAILHAVETELDAALPPDACVLPLSVDALDWAAQAQATISRKVRIEGSSEWGGREPPPAYRAVTVQFGVATSSQAAEDPSEVAAEIASHVTEGLYAAKRLRNARARGT